MTREEAKEKVFNAYKETRVVSFHRETPTVYIFKATNNRAIPSIIIVAVNKKTGNMGQSITAVEDAIRNAE